MGEMKSNLNMLYSKQCKKSLLSERVDIIEKRLCLLWARYNSDLSNFRGGPRRWCRELEHLCCEDRLWGLGLFCLESRTHQAGLRAAFQDPKGAYKKAGEQFFYEGMHWMGQGVMASDCNRVALDQVLGRNSLLWGWWGTGADFLEKLWMFPSWTCSIWGWVGPWAVWSSERWPCSRQEGLELDDR